MDYKENETYKLLYDRYKDSKPEDILHLYYTHSKSTNREGDFHFIGREVCKDIIKSMIETE